MYKETEIDRSKEGMHKWGIELGERMYVWYVSAAYRHICCLALIVERANSSGTGIWKLRTVLYVHPWV